MVVGQRVWIRNPVAGSEECYVIGKVVEDADSGADLVVALDADQSRHTLDAADTFTANPDGFVCPDNTQLIHLSEATLLANLRARYRTSDIYTLTGNILLVRRQPRTHRCCCCCRCCCRCCAGRTHARRPGARARRFLTLTILLPMPRACLSGDESI